MASALYGKGKASFGAAAINWTADTIKVVAVDTGAYTVSINTHEFLSDIAVGARIATSGALSGKTNTLGVMDASDVTFTAVTGASVEALVVYKDTGSAATSNLLAYIDSATSGLPFTPSGGDVTIIWSASGIFAI